MPVFELAQLKTDKSDKCQVWIPAPLSLGQMWRQMDLWANQLARKHFDVTLIINNHFYQFLIGPIQKPGLMRSSCIWFPNVRFSDLRVDRMTISQLSTFQMEDFPFKNLPNCRLHRTVFAPVRTVRPVQRFLKNELFVVRTIWLVRTVRCSQCPDYFACKF